MLCVQVTELEFSQVVKSKDAQMKKCLMINSSVSFRVQEIVEKDPQNGEDIPLTIPCIAIENSEYDESQGKFLTLVTKNCLDQQKLQFIPISSDLIFLKYRDTDEGKIALVFFYPSQDCTWMIESDDSHSE